jgi:hypothetical protein
VKVKDKAGGNRRTFPFWDCHDRKRGDGYTSRQKSYAL